MSAPRVGDWVCLKSSYPEMVARLNATFDRALPGSGTLKADRMGQWGQVVEPPEREVFLRLKGDEEKCAIRWTDGEVASFHRSWLECYEAPAERQVLADWLREHERPKLAGRVAAPSPEVWLKAVAAAWWHQPEARTLCEATGHPCLWEGVWQCAVGLRLGRSVHADITGWGVILWLEVGDGRATCPISAGIEPTPTSVADAAAILLEAERDAGVTTASAEGT